MFGLDRKLDEGFRDRLVGAFEAEYTRLFGRVCEGVPAEVIHWRVTVSGPAEHPDVAVPAHKTSRGGESTRPVVFDRSGAVETPVFDRCSLTEGMMSGPAIIEEAESTAVVPPEWDIEVRPDGALLLKRRSS